MSDNKSSHQYEFTEECVQEWCDMNNEAMTGDELFTDNIVPNMMLVDRTSSIVKEMFDGQTIISRLTAVRFRSAVFVGESVNISITVERSEDQVRSIWFEIKSVERSELAVNGYMDVVTGE